MFKIPDTDIVVEDGQSVVLIGPACSGKSTIASRIASFYPSSSKYIAFQDSYGYASDRAYYLQQRWNSTEFDEDAPKGGEILLRLAATPSDKARLQELIALFGIEKILDKDPITYSSGEIRKYQLVKSLIRRPSILVIDNPFIGLDPGTRAMTAKLLENLSRELSLVLVLSRPEEIPSFITHAIVCHPAYAASAQSSGAGAAQFGKPVKIPLQEYLDGIFGPEVISFNNVSVRYGNRTILKDLNWTVRRGEHWALTGENGCGKSTLLSLVCADNPMGYACDIRLWGRRRGSGESIWEIKKRIGYVSPEMHRAYRATQKARDIVTSGFFDTTALPSRPSAQQQAKVMEWMSIFGIEALADTAFNRLSSTQQRLTLVCRAFVKEPELLILDEPLHGLDNPSRFKVRGIIDDYCNGIIPRNDGVAGMETAGYPGVAPNGNPDAAEAAAARTLIMVTHYPEEYPSCIDHSLTLVKN